MRRSLTLGQRIALGASLLIFFVLFASGLGLWYARTSARNVALAQESVQHVSRLARLEATWGRVAATIDQMLLTRQAETSAEQLERELASFNEQLAQIDAQRPSIAPETVAENEQILITMRVLAGDLTGTSNEILDAARQRRWPQAQLLRHTELAGLQRRFDEQLSQLTRNTHNEVNQLIADSVRRQRRIASALTVALILGVAAGVTLTVLSVRAVTTPINQLIERVRQVTEGDFSYLPPLERSDEIGTLSRAFSMMTEWLQESYQVLEERVTERTHDLELAAEVGRRLSQVRELDELLPEAVELIRRRFDLYYTQVYLTSEDGRSLLLRAGTGEVGSELRRRGFQLPIDRNSLNGTAVLERHALVITDTSQSGRFRPNPLLPDTRSEIAMPLMSGERVVGVLDLQSSRRYGLTEDNLPAFEVLAGQLAIAIENALLFEEAREARAELQAGARRRVAERWQQFLDAVRRSERIGYAYEGGSIVADESPEPRAGDDEGAMVTSITLNDQPIGSIRLEADPAAEWSDDHLEMVEDVSRRVAQQIENLRILAESGRYRDEAESAVRRLTREGWESFYQSEQIAREGYLYDGRRVKVVDADEDFDLAQPLLVRGEEVGELVVARREADEGGDTAAFVSAVAARLSAHLENLRLARQTESALADVRRRSEELELLNHVVTRIASTLELRQSLQVVVEELVEATTADQARIGLLNEEQSELTIVAECFDESRSPSALDLRIPVDGNELTERVLETRRPVVVTNAPTHPLTEPIRDMLQEQGIQHMVVMPIMAGNEVIGTVGADILDQEVTFSDEQLRLAETIVFQAATTIQNARLFDQVQNALAETRSLYRASADLNAARTYEDVVRVIRQHALLLEESSTVSLALFDVPWSDSTRPHSLQVMAHWTRHGLEQARLQYRLADYPALSIMNADRPTLVEDVSSDPRLDERSRRELRTRFQAGAMLALPMLVGGQWIGHVVVMYPQARTFDSGQLQNARNLVSQAAVAVQGINLLEETNRLLESEQRQRRISDTLVRATGRMLGVMEERDIRWVVVEEIQNLVRPDLISLYTRLERDDALRLEIQDGPGRKKDQDGPAIGQVLYPRHRPDLWRAMKEDELVLVETEESSGQRVHRYVFPWRVGERVAGVIELHDAARDASMGEEDRASVEGVIQQAAIRLQSARLFQEAELRAEELAVLNEMGRALTALLDVPTVLETVLRFTSRLMDTSNFYVALHHPQEKKLSFPLLVRGGERIEWPERTLGDGLTEYVIRRAEALLIKGDFEEKVEELGLEPGGAGGQSWLGVPMLIGDEVLGVISVQDENALGAYDEHDQELLSAVGSAAAIALQNARLFEETQLRAAETEALYRASRRINTAEEYDEILAALHSHTILGREANSVRLNYFDRPWTEDEMPEWIDVLSRWSKLPADAVGPRYKLQQFSAAPDVLKPDEPALIADVANDPRFDENSRALFHERLGATSAIFVPLVVGGQWLGFISAVYEKPASFPQSEVRRLMALAGQAATAIHSIRLLKQARARAERERIIREITAQVRSATDVDVIMKTAVREVGRVLGRDTFVVLADGQEDGEEARQPAAKETG